MKNKIYRMRDIEKRYTEILGGYISKGYVLNTDITLSNHGTRLELSNGEETVKVMLANRLRRQDEKKKMTITVALYDKEFCLYDPDDTLLHEEYFLLGGNPYDPDNAVFTTDVGLSDTARIKREKRKRYDIHKTIFKSEKALEIALKIARRHPGYKRKKKSDIERVLKIGEGEFCIYHIWMCDKPDITILKRM